MAELELTEQNFEQEVIRSEIPVLVDFWATWCGPCRMMAPIVSALAEEKAGALKVCKVNVDEAPSLAALYRVDAIPTLVRFENGSETKRLVGYHTKDETEKLLA